MKVKEASKKWGISVKKVYQVCKALKVEQIDREYNIPDDLKKPYFPDWRKLNEKNNQLYIYVNVLNAITDELLIIPEIIHTDEQHVRTVVRELSKANVIVLLEGADDNLDYMNYMVGPKYADWKKHNTKEKVELIGNILSIVVNIASIAINSKK